MKGFWRDQGANVALLLGLSMPMLVGFGAIAVDLSVYRLRQNQLQTAADSAALRAAVLLKDLPTARTEAIAFAARNMPPGSGQVTKQEDVVFGVYDPVEKTFKVTLDRPNAVKVTSNKAASHSNQENRFLSKIWNAAGVDVRAKAIAVAQGPKACVFALAATAASSFQVQGSGRVSVPNCSIQINSSSRNALSIGGGGAVVAKSTCVVGGYSGNGATPAPETSCAKLEDPLKAVPEPTPPSGCSVTNRTYSSSETLSSNQTYCGNIHMNDGDIHFQSGIHYFVNATVRITNSASTSGKNVMLYLDKNSSLQIASSGKHELTAPASGPYKGILIFHSRSATAGIKITGSPQMTLGGTLYAPNTDLEMAGSGDISMKAKSGFLIARTFRYTGDIDFILDAYGGATPTVFGTKATLIN